LLSVRAVSGAGFCGCRSSFGGKAMHRGVTKSPGAAAVAPRDRGAFERCDGGRRGCRYGLGCAVAIASRCAPPALPLTVKIPVKSLPAKVHCRAAWFTTQIFEGGSLVWRGVATMRRAPSDLDDMPSPPPPRAGGMYIGGRRMGGSIADTIANARASLKNPSRPFTPADPQRRLHAHSQLLGKDGLGRTMPPPTPMIRENAFEAERPFTSLVKTPLPATGSKGVRALPDPAPPKVARRERGTGADAAEGSVPNIEILRLDDDDAPPEGAPEPKPQPSFFALLHRTGAVWLTLCDVQGSGKRAVGGDGRQ